ncbi:MAG: ZIP family metal transporter [Patescibacteria group bacterium]
MVQTWFAALLGVIFVSLISLVGVFSLSLQYDRLRKSLLYLVSFAAGAMLGDAFLHLMPEAFADPQTLTRAAAMVLVGIVLFFALEKLLFWRHCHLPSTEQHKHPVGAINLVSDGIHNFLDGVIIAGSFLVSVPLGIATTIAVILHEIPQEIGDFGILLTAGYTKKKALWFNFLTACLAIVGTIVTLVIGERVAALVQYLVPITIGGFIYIAAADLIPEIHREEHTGRSVLQFSFLLIGIGIMAIFLLLE